MCNLSLWSRPFPGSWSVSNQGFVGPSRKCAFCEDKPTGFLVVRACALHVYAADLATWVGVRKHIMFFGVISPFATRLALCNGGAYLLPKGLEFGRRKRKDACRPFDVRLALYTGGSRRVARGTAGIRVPSPSPHCTSVARSLEKGK